MEIFNVGILCSFRCRLWPLCLGIFCWNRDNVSSNVPQHQVLVLIGWELSLSESWAYLYQKSLWVSSGSQSVGCWHRLMRRSSPAKAEKLCFFPLTHRVHSLSMLKQSGFGSEDCGSLTFCTIPRYPEKQGKQP